MQAIVKATLFFCFLLTFPMVFSVDSITNYVVPTNVPLNQPATATGIFSDGDINGVLCSFYFLDADTQVILSRATDQYTDGTGRFAMPGYIVREPVFERGNLVTLKTTCGTADADANFIVGQKQEILPGVASQGLMLDALYWTDANNSFVLAVVFFLVLFVAAAFLFLYKKMF